MMMMMMMMITPFKRSRSFKVIGVGTNRKTVCDFLLVINSNWHPISYRFEVIADYCLNFGHFVFQSPFGGIRVNVYYSSWTHWKVRSGFPSNVNWTFLLAITAENRRFRFNGASLTQISGRRGRPTNHSSSHKTGSNVLSYGIKICTKLFSDLSQSTRLTDTQSDIQLSRS